MERTFTAERAAHARAVAEAADRQAGGGRGGAGDGDGGEPGRLEKAAVFALGEGAFEAADVLFGCGAPGGVGAFVGGDVADAQPSAGAQHPERFGGHLGFVGGQVDDAVGDDDVDAVAGQGDRLDAAA
jgi:hypothetical protein